MTAANEEVRRKSPNIMRASMSNLLEKATKQARDLGHRIDSPWTTSERGQSNHCLKCGRFVGLIFDPEEVYGTALNASCEEVRIPRKSHLVESAQVHNHSGRRLKSGDATLGVYIVALPWVIFSLGGWPLFLYLLLGLTSVLLCLDQRELRGRMRKWRVACAARVAMPRQKKFGLNPRELEIISAVVVGYSDKKTALYFKIGEQTVKYHVATICNKLGLSTRLQLAQFAVNHSLPLKEIV